MMLLTRVESVDQKTKRTVYIYRTDISDEEELRRKETVRVKNIGN